MFINNINVHTLDGHPIIRILVTSHRKHLQDGNIIIMLLLLLLCFSARNCRWKHVYFMYTIQVSNVFSWCYMQSSWWRQYMIWGALELYNLSTWVLNMQRHCLCHMWQASGKGFKSLFFSVQVFSEETHSIFYIYICQEFVDGDEFVMHVLACFDLDIIRFLNQTLAHELDS